MTAGAGRTGDRDRTAEIVESVSSLPTLSDSVAKLAAALQDDRTGAGDFVEIIVRDPALTANLLRLANAAYFGLSREVSSVKQAVAFLGTNRMFEVVASVSFARVLPRLIPGYEMDARMFWRHCSAVAILGDQLANEVGGIDTSMVFTAGLLHDVGKLVIGSFLEAESETVLARLDETSKVGLAEAEKAVFGIDHAGIGEAVTQTWNLPESIVAAARYHHHPDKASEGPHGRVVDIVHCADALAHTLGFGADIGEMCRAVDPAAVERLGLESGTLEGVACRAFEQIMELGDVLELSSEDSP